MHTLTSQRSDQRLSLVYDVRLVHVASIYCQRMLERERERERERDFSGSLGRQRRLEGQIECRLERRQSWNQG